MGERVNIVIMRAFVPLRGTLTADKELAGKLAELERRVARDEEGLRSLWVSRNTVLGEARASRELRLEAVETAGSRRVAVGQPVRAAAAPHRRLALRFRPFAGEKRVA